jgi:hypothetical protein
MFRRSKYPALRTSQTHDQPLSCVVRTRAVCLPGAPPCLGPTLSRPDIKRPGAAAVWEPSC